MRILHILPSLDESRGGPLRLVLDLSAGAASLGLESEVVGVGPWKVRDNPLTAASIHVMPPGRWKSWAYSPALRGWLRSGLRRFDGVVIHGAWLYPGRVAAEECQAA